MPDNIWVDYSFVIRGKQRRQIMVLMTRPKTPTELSKESGLNLSNTSRVLKQLEARGLVECLTPAEVLGRIYAITKKGEDVLGKVRELMS